MIATNQFGEGCGPKISDCHESTKQEDSENYDDLSANQFAKKVACAIESCPSSTNSQYMAMANCVQVASVQGCQQNNGNADVANAGAAADRVSSAAAHVTVSLSGCFFACGEIEEQGGHFTVSYGAIGFVDIGLNVGYAHRLACDRDPESEFVAGGEGIGGFGSFGVSDDTRVDVGDWETSFGTFGGFPVAGGALRSLGTSGC